MIIFRDVSKIFKGRIRSVHALKSINLIFQSTGLNFIVGQSGAGKTTLLNLLSLQDRCTEGKLLIDNKDVDILGRRQLASLRCQYFGIIFQNLNLIEDFSVYQNISIGMEFQRLTPSREEVLEILKQLNLSENILDEKACNLSGGQKQRVAIARALIKKPKAIICDEPTGSLDDENAIEIMQILKQISKDSLVIVVSHSKELSRQYADRIITLIDGKIQNDTNPVVIESDGDELKALNHTHMPFKSTSKLAFSSFRKSLPKVIFTLISFCLSLAVFMISMTIYSFDKDSALDKTLISERVNYFNLKKYGSSGIPTEFNETDLTIIEDFYKNKYILSKSSPDIFNSFSQNSEGSSNEPINNAIYLSSEMLVSCDFEILGRLPQLQDATTEIVLSKYDCYLLGWLKKEEMNNQTVLQKIIDNKNYKMVLSSQFIEFDIVGIIDTNYRFIDQDSDYADIIKQDQDNYEMHRSIFLCEMDFNNIAVPIFDGKKWVNSTVFYKDLYVLTEEGAYHEVDNLVQRFSDNGAEVNASCRIDYINIQFENMQTTYKLLSLILALFLLTISIFSFMGFITSSIRSNMKTIHILRTLGITGLDSIKIFSFQSIILSLMCIIFSIVPYMIAVNQINGYFRASLYTVISPLHVDFLIILLTFLGMLIFSLLMTILSVIWSFRKKRIIVKD